MPTYTITLTAMEDDGVTAARLAYNAVPAVDPTSGLPITYQDNQSYLEFVVARAGDSYDAQYSAT